MRFEMARNCLAEEEEEEEKKKQEVNQPNLTVQWYREKGVLVIDEKLPEDDDDRHAHTRTRVGRTVIW